MTRKLIEIDRWATKIRIAEGLMNYLETTFGKFEWKRKVVGNVDKSGGTYYDPILGVGTTFIFGKGKKQKRKKAK